MKKKKQKDKVINTLSVYMFHNLKFNLHLFINAIDFDEAMNQFDMCQFKNRKYWKVFLQTGQQPT